MTTKKDWIPIKLSDDDLALARQIGEARQKAKDRANIPDGRLAGGADSSEIHTLGFKAELAVARYLGVEPNTRVSARGNRGISLTVNGKKINVKLNRNQWGDLRYLPDKVPDVDYMILTVSDKKAPDTIMLVGWADQDLFRAASQHMPLRGQGMRVLLPQKYLWPMPEMLEELGLADPPKIQLELFDLGRLMDTFARRRYG